jgi:hypothetical protein
MNRRGISESVLRMSCNIQGYTGCGVKKFTWAFVFSQNHHCITPTVFLQECLAKSERKYKICGENRIGRGYENSGG